MQWIEGLRQLRRCRPPAGVLQTHWRAKILGAVRFCRIWGPRAAANGWTAENLFSLHPGAPLLRFDAMGVAFLGTDAVVVGVEPGAVLFRCKGGNINRGRPPTNPQKPAWLGPWMPALRPRASYRRSALAPRYHRQPAAAWVFPMHDRARLAPPPPVPLPGLWANS